MQTEAAILIGAGLATVGWVYTARRARSLARKQHTITVMLHGFFNKDLREAKDVVVAAIRKGECPDLNDDANKELKLAFRDVANYYEFIAAGVRNGDFYEQLIRDSDRAQILTVFEWGNEFIWKLRNARRRMTIYEHLEWLHIRWETKRPNLFVRSWEFIIGRPISGKRVNPCPP